MKILKIDNFNRDWLPDTIIAENVSEYYATKIVDFLNSESGDNWTQDYYRAVDDNYQVRQIEY